MNDQATSPSGKKRPERQSPEQPHGSPVTSGCATAPGKAAIEELAGYQLFLLERPGFQPDDG
jgi:hypothetical protein